MQQFLGLGTRAYVRLCSINLLQLNEVISKVQNNTHTVISRKEVFKNNMSIKYIFFIT